MPTNLLSLLLALLSGALMAVQGSMNTALSKVIGLLETTFIVHLIGTVVLIILLFILRMGKGNFSDVAAAPWYLYLGGLISVGIIYLVAASMAELGVANTTTAIIVGQVVTAIIIDHLGAFGLEQLPFDWSQLIGLVFLVFGANLLLK